MAAVIFDLAGTVVDHGSCAPVMTLLDVFERVGVPITTDEARLSMGLAKRDHLGSILALPRVREAWRARHGMAPDARDLSALYADFVPRQLDCLPRFSDVIDGVPDMVEHLRSLAVRIGSTTGYTRPMLEELLRCARTQGFSPDCAVCPDDVPGGGRPAPWMCYLNAIRLEAAPLSALLKIGDTPSDIAEGLNAGMWTIGITRTGNEVGRTSSQWDATPELERARLLASARATLVAAGAHYTAPSVGDCRDIVEEIAGRIAAGERPRI
jgi:phosphonoacetaldehyde hydrolase